MSVQIKGVGTIGGIDQGLDTVGVVTATSFVGSGANLTNLPAANITGTLPAISGANLTNLPAANITGTLPAISGANLTGVLKNIVEDTSPQLGGSLDVNNKNVNFGDSTGVGVNRARFGGTSLQIYHGSNVSHIAENGTGPLRLSTDEFQVMNSAQNKTMIYAAQNLAVSLNYNGNTKIQTTDTGAVVTGILTATTISSTNVVNSTQLSHRNKIINGATQIWQRGGGSNNYSGSHDGYYAGIADRWAIRAHSSMGTQTYDKNSNCPQGFSYSQRIYTTSADGGNAGKYYVFDTKLEGQDLRHFAKGLSGAKPFTLSFYVKCNINRVFTCELRDLDNNRMCVQQYTTTDSNWKRYVLTFPADTTGQFDSDNSASLWVRFWLSAGANFKSGTSQTTWGTVNDANICPGQTGDLGGRVGDYWYVTGIQLEVGDKATPFEHKSFIEDKLRCYRYYYKPERGSNVLELHGQGHRVADTMGAVVQAYPWPVEMRVSPTVSFDDNAGNSNRFAVNGSNNSTTNNVLLSLQQNIQGIMGAFQYPHGISGISENESFRLWAYNFNASAEL